MTQAWVGQKRYRSKPFCPLSSLLQFRTIIYIQQSLYSLDFNTKNREEERYLLDLQATSSLSLVGGQNLAINKLVLIKYIFSQTPAALALEITFNKQVLQLARYRRARLARPSTQRRLGTRGAAVCSERVQWSPERQDPSQSVRLSVT